MQKLPIGFRCVFSLHLKEEEGGIFIRSNAEAMSSLQLSGNGVGNRNTISADNANKTAFAI